MDDVEKQRKKKFILIYILVLVILVVVFFTITRPKELSSSPKTFAGGSPFSTKEPTVSDIEVYKIDLPSSVCEGSEVSVSGSLQIKTNYPQNILQFVVKDSSGSVLYDNSQYFSGGDNNFKISFKPKDYSLDKYTFVIRHKDKEAYKEVFILRKENPKLEVNPSYEKKTVIVDRRGPLIFYKIMFKVSSISNCEISNIKIVSTARITKDGGNLAKNYYVNDHEGIAISKLKSKEDWSNLICILRKNTPPDEEKEYGVSLTEKIEKLCYVYLEKPSDVMFTFQISADGMPPQIYPLEVEVDEIGYTEWAE